MVIRGNIESMKQQKAALSRLLEYLQRFIVLAQMLRSVEWAARKCMNKV